jgi:hypothetical protein
MKRIKVTENWAADRHPCPKAKREFFKRWPRGLTLTRRNLYMVADECPISWLVWLGGSLLCQGGTKKELLEKWWPIERLAFTSYFRGWHVRSSAKKQAFAKAFADLLGL